ncbi:ankyrin repeat domain-containing protein SOWAHA [Antennarius striatus]|uniref:ankyrin repeat domain-containing protein SOWAHA n=1 Tax=Antennarius striatus TaxID=241820 RepID=UPI0035B0FCB5
MALTQESILSLLIKEGGKIKKSDLVSKFKGSLECDDLSDRQQNREAFKAYVNNVAFVKEIDSVRYVVVKKMYHHLLEGVHTAEKSDRKEITLSGEQQRPPPRSERTESSADAEGERSAVSEPDEQQASGESSKNPKESISPLQLALQRSIMTDRVKRGLNVEIQNPGANGDRKPYALPLRMSPTRIEFRKLKEEPKEHPENPMPNTFRNKRPPLTEGEGNVSSPPLRRSAKSTKASDVSKETRVPSLVPLEQSEHEWMVRCAAGHWNQVYGLLLRDNQLAEKRDFISGFTALHWAVKCGNSKMLVNIIDLAKQGGIELDINVKTHGGYTPLHIAALHHQEYIMTLLVEKYRADPSVRDNCGKRAYHYLHKGISGTVRKLLGEPRAQQTQDRALHEKDELDLLPDLSKGFNSIGRLLQPHATGYKKKQKQRAGLHSLNDNPIEEREYVSSSTYRPRILSDVFM